MKKIPADKTNRPLTVPEAADLLGISERAAWQRIYRGQLPHRRWGRRVLIPVADLARFLADLPGLSVEDAITKAEAANKR